MNLWIFFSEIGYCILITKFYTQNTGFLIASEILKVYLLLSLHWFPSWTIMILNKRQRRWSQYPLIDRGHPWHSGNALDYWPTRLSMDPVPLEWFTTKSSYSQICPRPSIALQCNHSISFPLIDLFTMLL